MTGAWMAFLSRLLGVNRQRDGKIQFCKSCINLNLVYSLHVYRHDVSKWEAQMSTNTIIRTGLIATLGVSALSISAFSNAQTASRYGNIGAYEGGHCQHQPCPAPVQQAPAFIPQQQVAPSVVYTPAPAPVYTQSAPVYQQPAPVYSQPSQILPGACPSGTTAQPNGTCLEPSYSSNSYSAPATTYSAQSTYSEPTYSSSSSYSTTQSAPADCPAGTTAQSDGTCLQTGSSFSSSSSSTSSYPSSSSS